MEHLKLIAFDSEDLAVISAHLQDAVVKIGDLAFLPREHRFVAVLNRFDWGRALSQDVRRRRDRRVRRQTALRFELVQGAQVQGLDLDRKSDVLALLAIEFQPARPDDPAGLVTLHFSGGAAIRLNVECIEAEMKDLGPAWSARSEPKHAEE